MQLEREGVSKIFEGVLCGIVGRGRGGCRGTERTADCWLLIFLEVIVDEAEDE